MWALLFETQLIAVFPVQPDGLPFVEMILRLNQVVYAPFYALFFVGPTAMLIEAWLESRRENPAVAIAAAT